VDPPGTPLLSGCSRRPGREVLPARCPLWTVSDLTAHLAATYQRFADQSDRARAGDLTASLPPDQLTSENLRAVRDFRGDPVPLGNRIRQVTCRSSVRQAVCVYSLIRPPRTGFRRMCCLSMAFTVVRESVRFVVGYTLGDALVRLGRVVVHLVLGQDGRADVARRGSARWRVPASAGPSRGGPSAAESAALDSRVLPTPAAPASRHAPRRR
jgi:hypothetical protein